MRFSSLNCCEKSFPIPQKLRWFLLWIIKVVVIRVHSHFTLSLGVWISFSHSVDDTFDIQLDRIVHMRISPNIASADIEKRWNCGEESDVISNIKQNRLFVLDIVEWEQQRKQRLNFQKLIRELWEGNTKQKKATRRNGPKRKFRLG